MIGEESFGVQIVHIHCTVFELCVREKKVRKEERKKKRKKERKKERKKDRKKEKIRSYIELFTFDFLDCEKD